VFKVSLLPDSYRRHLQSRDKIDIVSKFALVVLVCLFIIYGGFAIKNAVLESKLKKLERENARLEAEFPALQEYQNIYDSLISSRQMIASITPSDGPSVDFFTKIANSTPDYVQINEIDIEDWFSSGVCTLQCTVQDYQDMKDFENFFKSEEMQEIVKGVELANVQRQSSSNHNKSVNFTLVLSTQNALTPEEQAPQYVTVTDENGEAVTNEDGEVATTDAAAATTAASSD